MKKWATSDWEEDPGEYQQRMPSYTKITSKLHKISNISSAVGISHVKNCTIPFKDVSDDIQIVLSPIIKYKAETVVCPTKVNASSTSYKRNIAQEFPDSKTGRNDKMGIRDADVWWRSYYCQGETVGK